MELNWIYFVGALLLLFLPSYAGGTARLWQCSYEDIRNNRGGAAAACFRMPWLWLDPLRAFAGGWLLRNAWLLDSPLPGIWKHFPLAATLLVLALALGAQMHTRSETHTLMAPVGYCAGLVFALLPPQVAVLVVALAGVCLMAFRGWWAFFFFGAAAAAGFGYMILRTNLWMVGTVALLMEPVLLSLLFKRVLTLPVVSVRKRVVVKRTIRRAPSGRDVKPKLRTAHSQAGTQA